MPKNIKKITNNSKYSYFMYGKHAVKAAILNPKREISRIFCTQDVWNKDHQIISMHPYEILPTEFLTKLLQTNNNSLKTQYHPQVHQGIIAQTNTIFHNNINTLNLQNQKCKVAILDQVTDPQNIGTIIRSAAALNISAIILPKDNSPDENATIAKAACGALELIDIIKVINLQSTIKYLKDNGFWIIALDGESEAEITPKLLSGKIAMIIGSEEKGARKLTIKNSDYTAKIPMSNKVESLNVANAAAIAFYLSSLDK